METDLEWQTGCQPVNHHSFSFSFISNNLTDDGEKHNLPALPAPVSAPCQPRAFDLIFVFPKVIISSATRREFERNDIPALPAPVSAPCHPLLPVATVSEYQHEVRRRNVPALPAPVSAPCHPGSRSSKLSTVTVIEASRLSVAPSLADLKGSRLSRTSASRLLRASRLSAYGSETFRKS